MIFFAFRACRYAPLQVFEMIRERLYCPGFFEQMFMDSRFYW